MAHNVIKRLQHWLNMHPKTKNVFENIIIIFGSIISSLLAAYTFRSFIVPSTDVSIVPLITGGVSGVSQILNRLFDLLNILNAIDNRTLQATFYFLLNIPIFILGYAKIGKRFAIFSMINVILTSIFIEIIPEDLTLLVNITEDLLSRAIIAGLLQGLASSIAYVMEISSGGMDVVTYYFANVKSTSVGKFAILINTIILLIFTTLYLITTESTDGALNSVIFSIIYFFTTSKVVDTINVRNKKTSLQIVTSVEHMPKVIMEKFHHGCTVVKAKGGFTNNDKYIIYIVVSSVEAQQVIRLVRLVDPDSFIDESYSHQVYGRFFIKPVK
jgi:uncharacterized membrane-anchored protein YitT (DUF2179 family)